MSILWSARDCEWRLHHYNLAVRRGLTEPGFTQMIRVISRATTPRPSATSFVEGGSKAGYKV